MASLFKSDGTWRIDFAIGTNGQRRSIRLGRMDKHAAESAKLRIEKLIAAKVTNGTPDPETLSWVAGVDDKLHGRLAAVGLVKPREQSQSALAAFVDGLIESRTDIKPTTKRWYTDARKNLVDCLGANTPLQGVGPAEADKVRLALEKSGLGPNTVRRRIGICRQIFNAARRFKLIEDNPFSGMATDVKSNPDKFRFITPEETKAILDHCPDATWKAIVALVRCGGLRCPSEVLALKWGHLNWEKFRLIVPSSKTSHHEGKASRVVPLFPELRDALAEAFEQAKEGEEYIIQRYRNNAVNLRTHLERIIRRAGITPWPKLFVNLRSSRETELVKDFPIHTVTAWLGNSPKVAMKHYLQVTDAEFERAAGVEKKSAAKNAALEQQNPQQQAPASACGDVQTDQETPENRGLSHAVAQSHSDTQNGGNARDRNRTCIPFGTGT
jgi:integrase